MILIALGANLPSRSGGTPEETLAAAQDVLRARGVGVIAASRVWITPPVPVSDQPFYRNAVVSVATSLDPEALFVVLKDIERDFGRESAEKDAARVLDLDILAYNEVILNSERLTVPHARLQDRTFVLLPLMDINPHWVHPVLKKSVVEMLLDLPEDHGAKPVEAGSI